ncbi:MAG: M61 family peptidase [Bacteroidetes bacterium]|nr:M61 family peptidase [Bacteroidota bacterium]
MTAVTCRLRRDVANQNLTFRATFPERNAAHLGAWSLQLPTWRPGRYELGNFAQYIMSVEGFNSDGSRQALAKSSLHTWIVPAGVRDVEWVFHADILNAGSTCVEADLYYVNPVNCFMYDLDRQDLPYEIVLEDLRLDPETEGGWALATALPWEVRDGSPAMRARDVQHLMDSPWIASPKLWRDSYREQDVDVHVWIHDTLPSDPTRFMADHAAFTRSQLAYFGSFPTDEYHFLYLFPDRDVRHGVEHEDSTVIALGPAERVRSEEGYMEILGIASHELYHAWNVKRIRPAEWTPYDFTGACPSDLGYIAEGVTTYMGDLFLFESGIVDLKGWCDLMAKLLERHLNNPGRLNLSVAQSSYDTWLDGYRVGVPGRKGSIYVEGAVLAFLCDTRIMERTGGQASLSTAMRLLWERYGKPRTGLTADMYWDVLAEVAGERLDDLRRDHAEGTADTWPPLVHAFATQGLALSKGDDDAGLTRVTIAPASA